VVNRRRTANGAVCTKGTTLPQNYPIGFLQRVRGGGGQLQYGKSAEAALPSGLSRSHPTTWRPIVNALTTVELLWLEKRIENRIRFGRPVAEQIIDRRRILSFAPGTVFAFVRWASNDFGTAIARVDILRAATPGQRYSTVPWVKPGGNILLRLTGWPKVERVLQLIDAVEALDIHPADVAPDYWHHVHNRLSVNETPRSYTRARHQAWLRRQRIAP
jgi:hypothetical protein